MGATCDSSVTNNVGITGLLKTFSLREVFFACEYRPNLPLNNELPAGYLELSKSQTSDFAPKQDNNHWLTSVGRDLSKPWPSDPSSRRLFARQLLVFTPCLVVRKYDFKFNNFTTTALTTLQWDPLAHQPGISSLVNPKSHTRCFPLPDVPASFPFPPEHREFLSEHPAAAEHVSLLTCTVRGFLVGAVSWLSPLNKVNKIQYYNRPRIQSVKISI